MITLVSEPADAAGPIAHRLRLLPDVAATVESLGEDLGRAVRRAWIETYICRDDDAGRALVARLAAAVGRGADVRLLVDPLGCRDTPASFFRDARRRGIDVRCYRPQVLAPFGRHLGIRNHGRAAVIDDVAYTGGANVGHEWLPRTLGGDGWHDVCVRIVGPCVEEVRASFELRWDEAHGWEPPQDHASGDRFPDVEWVSSAPGVAPGILGRHLVAFRRARRRIWLENAYCLPPPVMLDALGRAAARGVDVQLIVPRRSDLPWVRFAACAEYARWLELGLGVHEYLPSVLHSKVAVVDDAWAAIGTFNAMSVSVWRSIESCLFLHDPATVAEVAALLARDRTRCARIERQQVAKRSVPVRVRDRAANLALRAFDGCGRRG